MIMTTKKIYLNTEVAKRLHYSVTQRPNPSKKEEPPKFYANAQAWSTVNERELSEMISTRASLTRGDVLSAITLLIQVMRESLLSGQKVRLGEFGTFYLTMNSTGALHEEDFTEANIQRVNLRFRPGQDFKDILARMQFVKDDPKYIIRDEATSDTSII